MYVCKTMGYYIFGVCLWFESNICTCTLYVQHVGYMCMWSSCGSLLSSTPCIHMVSMWCTCDQYVGYMWLSCNVYTCSACGIRVTIKQCHIIKDICRYRYAKATCHVCIWSEHVNSPRKKYVEVEPQIHWNEILIQRNEVLNILYSHKYTREIPESAPFLYRHGAQIGGLRVFHIIKITVIRQVRISPASTAVWAWR